MQWVMNHQMMGTSSEARVSFTDSSREKWDEANEQERSRMGVHDERSDGGSVLGNYGEKDEP